jgi:hypothetical protein
MSAAFNLPVQTATANWFIRKRSVALAVICAAPALSGLMANPLGNRIASQVDLLKSVSLGLGVVMLAIGVPMALVIRHKPEQYGFLPDGRVPTIEETGRSVIEKDNLATEVNFSLLQAL